jgi:putative nucleotidyltransferase with HDIG domain
MADQRLDLILHQLDELPTLPAVAVRVLDATGRDDTAATDVTRLLESDPALSARILKLVHRSDLAARGGTAETVARAVALLGFDAVRCATLAVAVYQTLGGTSGSAGVSPTNPNYTPFDRAAFWTHSLAVACCADLLATRLPVKDVAPAQAFLCGLLHDVGKAALDAALPKSFARVVEGVDLLRGNIADVERSVIGVDHMTAGRRLAERWRLPEAVADVVWLHGQPPAALPKSMRNAKVVHLVTLADLLVRQQHLGYSGNYVLTDRGPLLAALGLSAADADAVVAALVGHMEPRATALGLNQASGDELYRSALTRANRELGQIGSQLAAKNRRLAARSKYFDAGQSFQAELRPDAPPADVLRAVAHTAAGLLGTSVVAAFSMPPGEGSAQVVTVDAEGTVLDISNLKFQMSSGGPASTAPLAEAGADLEPLVASVGPRLPDAGRFWVPLVADTGGCVGGVLWGAAPGEPARLEPQFAEMHALAHAWALAVCTAQVRDAHRVLAEQLADANRRLVDAQDALAQTRAMKAVAEMAAGAAHEMNNPLAIIVGRAEMLAGAIVDTKLQRSATIIAEQGHRLSGIISDLMDFARPAPPAVRAVAVASLVESALALAKGQDEWADRTVVTTVPNVPPVRVDAGQLAAALAELVGNAVQATDPKTGRITLSAGHAPGSSDVVLTVTDNGCGMDDTTARRAFDPFFSGRPAGRRRGLGLAKALRIVEAVGGSVRLDSRPGRGTTAVVLLPAVTVEVQSAQVPPRLVVGGSA